MSEDTGKIEQTEKEAKASKQNEELTAEDLEQVAGGSFEIKEIQIPEYKP